MGVEHGRVTVTLATGIPEERVRAVNLGYLDPATEETQMLRPQDTATRERKSLTGLWRFALDPDGAGRGAGWFREPLPGARRMAVPASFNDIAADAAVRDYFGDIWYQTTVRVPPGWNGQRVVLHFESATHRATVWVDDTEVVSHEGGYTPFEADVTDHVRPGGAVRITVVVNNTLSFQTVPPGVIEDTPDGKRQRCRTTRTPRTSWTRPTAAASWSSTRPPPWA